MAKAMKRSPNYPSFNLGDAIERVRRIYKIEHTHPADREAIVKDLGYTSLNGASLTAISTITQYALLEKAGDTKLRVSDDAVTILELAKGNKERAAAIKRLGLAPKLFEELYDTFGDRLPGDENLRLWLIRKGFNQKATDGIIRVYRETIELVNEETKDYNTGEQEDSSDKIEREKSMQTSSVKSLGTPSNSGQNDLVLPPVPENQRYFPLYLSKEQKAALYVPALMSRREYELLKMQIDNHLAIMEATIVHRFKAGDSVKVVSNTQHRDQIGTISSVGEITGDMVGRVEKYWVRFEDTAESFPYDDNDLELVRSSNTK